MARMWTTGFETQSATLEFGVNSGNIVTGTTPTMQTTVKRRGTCAARFQPSAAQSYIEHQITSGVVQRTFHRLYIRVATFPSTDTNIYAIGQSGFFPCSLRLKTDGTLLLRDSGSSTDLTGSMVLSTNRWYRVELDFTDGASGTGAFKLYVDGSLIANQVCSVINGFSRIRMGVSGVAATMDYYMDDVAINDDTGSVQNGLPGPGAVVHLLPNAAGDNNLFGTAVGGTAGGANNFTRVSERTPDDGTSYNQTTATGTTTIDDFNVTSSSTAGIGTADTITCVQVGGRVASDVTSAASIVYRLKAQAAGTVTESASVPVNNTSTAGAWSVQRGQSPRPYQLTSYVSPQDGSAWTAAKLDNAQIGYRGDVSSTVVRRISTLWALVDFVPIFALGVASEGNTATHLEYAQAAIPLVNLVDDFNDNTIDTALWPNSFGTISEVGGKARVPINTGYNAYSSAKAYKLQGSQVTVQAFPPNAGAAEAGVTESWAQVLIKSNVDGTDLGFEIQLTSGSLICFRRTGFSDPEPATYTYSDTNHRWLRIRETGGSVYFDAAPDGHTWTNLRTITSPSWVADGDLEFQLIGHRADGTNNYVEYDNVNVLFPQVVNLGLAHTADIGKALVGHKFKSVTHAATGDHATAATAKKTRALGRGNTGDHATALDANKLRVLGFAHTADQGRPLAVTKVYKLGVSRETNTATALGHSRLAHLGVSRETNTGRAVDANKLRTIGAAAEASTGRVTHAVRLVTAHVAHTADQARPIVAAKVYKLGVSRETNTAQGVVARKLRVIGHAATGDTARGLVASKRYSVAPAAEEAAGGATTGRKSTTLGVAHTQDGATEVVTAQGVTVGHAAEVGSGRPMTARKLFHLGAAHEVSNATALDPNKTAHLGVSRETNTARALSGHKYAHLSSATVADAGEGVEAFKRSGLDPAKTTDTAHALHIRKTRVLGRAGEISDAHPVVFVQSNPLGHASTVDSATPLGVHKLRNLVHSAVADVARGVAASKLRTLGAAHERAEATSVAAVKTLVLGVARETVEAHGVLESPKRRLARAARVADTAHPVRVVRQRPADSLTPGFGGPTLTPGTGGPILIASSIEGGGRA